MPIKSESPDTQFWVSYCVMTEEAGASPFWHAFTLLSEQTNVDAPIEVKNSFGFYSEVENDPDKNSTTNPIIKGLKHILGFKMALQDVHGHIQKEEIRYLDGLGLRGISFKVTATQYHQLEQAYDDKMDKEKKAIERSNLSLNQKGIVPNSYTRLVEELALAKKEKRAPDLELFHVTMSYSLNTELSSTCKTHALQLLLDIGIINEKEHRELLGGETAYAFPRYSGLELHPIQLVSTGEPQAHASRRTSNMHYSRSFEYNQLFWTHPPQVLGETLSQNEIRRRKNQQIMITNILSHLRAMEDSLRHAIAAFEKTQKDDTHLHDLEIQRDRIRDAFEFFPANACEQDEETLARNMLHAETRLNIAKMTLIADKVNYSFILRAYESIALRYALLSLVLLIVASTILTGTVGIVASIGAALGCAYNLFDYAVTEVNEDAMRRDYRNFHNIMNTDITQVGPMAAAQTPRQ